MSGALFDILVKMFPCETVFFSRSNCEVNGLPKDVVPVGNILARFVPKTQPDREFFLVDLDDTLVLLRICDAYEGAGYDKFAVIHATSLDSPALTVRSTFERWKDSL